MHRCRLTAVGVMCCAAYAVLGIQYVVLRHSMLGDQWNSLQLPLDASLVSAAPYELVRINNTYTHVK